MNDIKKLFQGMSSWMQLIFLLLFVFASYIILAVIIAFIMLAMGVDITNPMAMMESTSFLRISLFVQSPILFFLPACLWGFLFNNNIGDGLKINKVPDIRFVILGVLLIIVIQPFISFTGYYNDKLALPESLSWLERMMRSMEDTAAAQFDQLLSGRSFVDLILNLVLIAVFAGICEEFLFRGALQQIFRKIIGNYHITVWLTSFIFSAIHLQFYGFVPRLILGAVLGYLFIWSANLWVPVLVHTLNNAFSVVLYHIYGKEALSQSSSDTFGVGDTSWGALVSIALSVLIMIYMSKMYLRRSIEQGEI